MQEYRVLRTGGQVDWSRAEVLDHFIYPWWREEPPATTFQALWDEADLYFRFEVEDRDIRTYEGGHPKMDVVRSDRVEIFFRADERMAPYYCLEMDPLGRVLDYRADYYRRFDYEWQWPSGLDVKAAKMQNGYVVMGQISLASLRELGLLKSNVLEAGLFRANCVSLEGDQADFHWISWVDPGTQQPDFHVAGAFGVLRLEK